MPHHGREVPSDWNDHKHLEEELSKLRDKVGATGDYPKGKLCESDEGGINIAIGVKEDRVIIDFGTEIVWVGFDAASAVEVAMSLIEQARKISKEPITIRI